MRDCAAVMLRRRPKCDVRRTCCFASTKLGPVTRERLYDFGPVAEGKRSEFAIFEIYQG
jgi:hypothetical protein